MEKIKIVIKDHPTMGNKRAVEFEGIEYLSYTLEEAKLVWHERFLDNDGNLIDSKIIPIRRVVTPISNQNKVYETGVLIDRENMVTLNPIGLDETEEDYTIRINEQLASDLLTGIPEFDFWMNAVGWESLVIQAGTLLESFNRFDRTMNERKIILSEAQIQKLETFLYELPMKYAQPLLKMLEEGIQNEPEKAEQVLPQSIEANKI